jgi:hypothetical protein
VAFTTFLVFGRSCDLPGDVFGERFVMSPKMRGGVPVLGDPLVELLEGRTDVGFDKTMGDDGAEEDESYSSTKEFSSKLASTANVVSKESSRLLTMGAGVGLMGASTC